MRNNKEQSHDLHFSLPYPANPKYQKKVAYFSMEYAIHQPLKAYAGGLGFLAGSHLRSAFDLRQPLVGIGILWKYGYNDQVRKGDQCMIKRSGKENWLAKKNYLR